MTRPYLYAALLSSVILFSSCHPCHQHTQPSMIHLHPFIRTSGVVLIAINSSSITHLSVWELIILYPSLPSNGLQPPESWGTGNGLSKVGELAFLPSLGRGI